MTIGKYYISLSKCADCKFYVEKKPDEAGVVRCCFCNSEQPKA